MAEVSTGGKVRVALALAGLVLLGIYLHSPITVMVGVFLAVIVIILFTLPSPPDA